MGIGIKMKFEESRTKENLEKALQGEALAHLKYEWYKSKLVDYNKGYGTILDEIIHNEKEHGKLWFKLLHGGEVPSNEENLLDAIKGETYEATEMYVGFRDVAIEEGFKDIAELFDRVADIEDHHSKMFRGMSDELDDYYDEEGCWRCLNCGYESGYLIKAPIECPVCGHPQKYFVRG